MNRDRKITMLISAIIMAFIAFVVINLVVNSQQADKEQKQRMASIGKVGFEGRVINSKIYDYKGKSYYMICVKMFRSNTNNFYV